MADSPGPLTSSASAELIRARIDENRLLEARFLFKKISSEIDPASRRQLHQQLESRIEKARTLFDHAEQLEEQGRYEEAREIYIRVLDVAIDFPDVDQSLQRVIVALKLGPLRPVTFQGDERQIQEQNELSSVKPQFAPGQRSPFLPRGKRTLVFGIVGVLALCVVLGVFWVNNKLPASAGKSGPEVAASASGTMEKSVTQPIMPKVVFEKEAKTGQSGGNIVLGRAIEPPIVPDKGKPAKMVHAPDQEAQGDNLQAKPGSDFSENIKVADKPAWLEQVFRSRPQQRMSATEILHDSELLSDKIAAPVASEPEVAVSVPFDTVGLPLNSDGTYTVQPGDSLGGIAIKVYGSSKKWQQLYALNRDQLFSPSALQVGQKLRVSQEESKIIDHDPVGE